MTGIENSSAAGEAVYWRRAFLPDASTKSMLGRIGLGGVCGRCESGDGGLGMNGTDWRWSESGLGE